MPYPSSFTYPSGFGVYPGLSVKPLTPSTRFTAVGTTRVYFLRNISSASLVPTRSELDAGVDLTAEIADWNGWTITGLTLPVLDLDNTFERSVPGSLRCPISSLTFYASKNGIDARMLLQRGTPGHIVFLDGGDVAGNRAETYRVIVASSELSRSFRGDQADKIITTFVITTQPAQGVSVPA